METFESHFSALLTELEMDLQQEFQPSNLNTPLYTPDPMLFLIPHMMDAISGSFPADAWDWESAIVLDGQSVINPSKNDKIQTSLTKDKRGYIILNLWETEVNYLRDLLILEDSIKKQMIENRIISETAIQLIFAHTDHLLQLHQRFKEELEQRVLEFDTLDTRIGQLFIDFKNDFMEIYKKFIEGYAISRKQFTSEIKTNQLFQQFIQDKKKEHQWKLDDLLVLPVQRTTRYHLLLRDLLKETPEEHPDYHSLQSGWDCMKALAETVNERKRKADESMGLFVAFEQTKNCPVTLVNAKRRMIGSFNVIDQKTSKPWCLFLCSDLLMLTTMIEQSYFKKRSGDEKKYKFIRWIDLKECVFEDLGDSGIAFSVGSPLEGSLTNPPVLETGNTSYLFNFEGADSKKSKSQFILALEDGIKRCSE